MTGWKAWLNLPTVCGCRDIAVTARANPSVSPSLSMKSQHSLTLSSTRSESDRFANICRRTSAHPIRTWKARKSKCQTWPLLALKANSSRLSGSWCWPPFCGHSPFSSRPRRATANGFGLRAAFRRWSSSGSLYIPEEHEHNLRICLTSPVHLVMSSDFSSYYRTYSASWFV